MLFPVNVMIIKYSGDVPIKMVRNIISWINGYRIAIGVATKNTIAGLITLETLLDKLYNKREADELEFLLFWARISEPFDGLL